MELNNFDKAFNHLKSIEGNLVSSSQRSNFDPDSINVNSLLTISGTNYRVLKKGIYSEVGEDFEWVEFKLVDIITQKTCYLEIEDDDEIVVSFSDRKIRNSELDLEQLNLEFIDDLDDFKFEGKKYKYDDDYICTYKEDSKKELHATMYEFYSKKEKASITFEYWDSETSHKKGLEVWKSKEISLSDINLIVN
jgi:hypothetical protein